MQDHDGDEDQIGTYGTYKKSGVLRTLEARLEDMRRKRSILIQQGPYQSTNRFADKLINLP